MKKNVFALLLSLTMLALLPACGEKEPPPADSGTDSQTVSLTVWGAEEDEALLQETSMGSSPPAAASAATWSSAKAKTSAPCSISPNRASLQWDSLWGWKVMEKLASPA